jgi:3-phenylpropionate/trans-cinnamate dioxygenase ferredoxin subunit
VIPVQVVENIGGNQMADLLVAKSGDIAEGKLVKFEVNGIDVAIANVAGTFHAFGDVCTHAHCSLAEGELEGSTVTCPCHGSQFDVTTGAVQHPPATEPVPSYPVSVDGDDVKVRV